MTRSPLRRLVFGALHRLLYLWVRSETINQSAFTLKLDRSRPVVAVCRSGARSAQATVLLGKAGFETLLACDVDACGGIPFAEALDVLPIEQDSIDLGEAVAQSLFLALDPYPRADPVANPAADQAISTPRSPVSRPGSARSAGSRGPQVDNARPPTPKAARCCPRGSWWR